MTSSSFFSHLNRSRSLMAHWRAWSLGLGALLGSAQAHAQEPAWIWNSPRAAEQASAEPVVFRKTLELEQKFDSLRITVACDNRYEIYFDGASLGRGETWDRPQQFVVSGLSDAGTHLLAVRAKNDGEDPAGLVVKVEGVAGNESQTLAVSDASWKTADEKAIEPLWWRRSDATEAAWQDASVLGVVGTTAPWGNRINWGSPETLEVARSVRPAQEKFEFLDGDRVTMIGGTWVERLQHHNYFEAIVASAYPDRNIQFRNLGWSGDEVTGIARAVFGSPQDGFTRLKDDLLRTSPNVILVGYGGNEAFAGPAGLEAFQSQWTRLVELLESTGATLVFVSPPYHEKVDPRLPDPTQINQNIDLYSEAIREWSTSRGHHFVDFRNPRAGGPTANPNATPEIRDQLTENGMHFTDYGQWRAAQTLASLLGVPERRWELAVDLNAKKAEGVDTEVTALEVGEGRIRWVAEDKFLPLPSQPASTPRGGEFYRPADVLKVEGLPEGKWGLNIDGRPAILASAEQWAQGVVIDRSRTSSVEELRQTIAFKNELYFHRYRPQNETYLFLFRKHEQGNNAVEIPQFDPLVEQREEVIGNLRQPRSMAMELVPISDQ